MANAFLDFVPLKWQQRFLESSAKSPWAIGGNRSGKTEIGAFKLATHLIGFCPFTGKSFPSNGKYWAVGLDFPQVTQVMKPKLEKYIGLEGVDYDWHEAKQYLKMRESGCELWFKSCDSKRKKFQGADLDGVWFDEEPPWDVFKETWTRTIDRGGQVWGTMTPIARSAWVYQKIYSAKDPKFEIIQMAMTDNRFLPKAEIESARSLYADEDEIAVRIKGEYRLVIGRPVLHIPSVQNIHDLFIRPPQWRGDISDDYQLLASNGGDLRIWEAPKPGVRYVIGVDTAEGLEGGDYSCAWVIEGNSKKHVATWHGLLDPYPFAKEVEKLARCYNTALLAVERNAQGGTVLSRLVNDLKYENLYRQKDQADKHEKVADAPYGYHTNAQSKFYAVNLLKQVVRQTIPIRDHRWYTEAICWVLDDRGRPSTSDGANDDTLMASAIAYAAAHEHIEPIFVPEVPGSGPSESRVNKTRNQLVWRDMLKQHAGIIEEARKPESLPAELYG